jgi:ATP-dependent helicase/nuclease subunit A
MKGRLADAMEQARGVQARAEVEWAYVSTIHGFCSRLLRENALEAGIDPAFDVLDEIQSGTLLNQAFARVGAAISREMPDAAEALSRLVVTDPLEAAIDLYRDLRGAGCDPADLEIAEPDAEVFRAAMGRVFDAFDALAGLAETASVKSAEKAARVLDFSLEIRRVAEGPPEAALGILDATARAINLSVSKEMKEVLRPLREEILPAAIRAAADFGAVAPVAALRDLLIAADREYLRAREDAGALDFADLELRTIRLLREHAPVRDAVRRRFRQVLVDEYQDVNPVQEAIIAEIRTEGQHFAVGDVKQAIYGFRHADPRLFDAYSREVGDAGRVVLKENFRSDPALVEFANHCFSRLFSNQDLVAFTDMAAARPEPGSDAPAVEIMKPAGERAGEAREAEATAIARRIRRFVRDGEAAYGDVAILFRALTDVKTYERALEEHDVPFYIMKGGGFYQAREIVDLTCLLKTVRNPLDQIALAATLRSPFAALGEDALLTLALTAKRRRVAWAGLLSDPGAVDGLSAADGEKWVRFADLLERLRTLAARGTIREVAETALDESGYGRAVWMLSGGRRRAANLEKALELADTFEGRFDLAEFIDALAEFRAREIRETEAPTGGEHEDVVRLLTVHSAKGLEFPVVFVPDLSRSGGARAPEMILNGRGIGVRIRDEAGDGRHETTLFAESKEDLARREREEATRVFYVAVTRAERKLVLSGRDARRGKDSWWASLSEVFDLGGDEVTYGPAERSAPIVSVEPEEAVGPRRVSLASRHRAELAAGEPLEAAGPEAFAVADRLIEQVRRPRPIPDLTPFQNTISELLCWTSCPFCHYLRYHLGVPLDFSLPAPVEVDETGDGDRTGLDELPPTDFGIAVHEVLKAFDPHGGVPILDAARARLSGLLPEVPRGLPELTAGMVSAFYDSETGREVLAVDPVKVRREVPFLTRWPTGDDLPDLLFRGQIDLLYPRPDGELRILDYKTGRASSRYDVQMVAYARAVRGLGGGAVSAALAYLSREGAVEIAEVPLTDETLAAAEEQAKEFARSLAKGERPAGHSADCPATRP